MIAAAAIVAAHCNAASRPARPAAQASGENAPAELYAGSTPAPEESNALTRLARLAAGKASSLAGGAVRALTGQELKRFEAELGRINRLESMAKTLVSRQDFAAKTAEFKARLAAGETLEQIRPEAYAVARQAAALKTAEGLRAYDCQMLGALAMDGGYIAEMKTGEGKTLSAVMPLYLNALMGKGAHLITVNDSLAQRDKDQMAPVFEHLGLTVGCVLESQDPEQKRAGYACDVTYTTDRALGFDLLRDQVASDPAQRVQREPYFALIDEVDEVLIDEARVPLILSAQDQPAGTGYRLFSEIISELAPGQDYQVDRKEGLAWLTPSGLERVETALDLRETEKLLGEAVEHFGAESTQASELAAKRDHLIGLGEAIKAEGAAAHAKEKYEEKRPGLLQRVLWGAGDTDYQPETARELEDRHQRATDAKSALAEAYPPYSLYALENLHLVHPMDAALKARALYDEGKDYVVEQAEVLIVDENKGRTAQGQRYHHGVHQAIEAKEGLPVANESRTQASITYPNLFKRYPRLAGMSGTAKTSRQELRKLYGLEVLEIPTNKPVIRVDRPDTVFATAEQKYQEATRQAVEAFRSGRPVLLGTLSVQDNIHLAQRLVQAGIPTSALQVLNAQTVRGDKDQELAMIAQAGRCGTVTVATNMAGRGQNIRPDLINVKELAVLAAQGANDRGQAVMVDFSAQEMEASGLGKKAGKEAFKLAQWLNGRVPYLLEARPEALALEPGQVLLRLAPGEAPLPDGAVRLTPAQSAQVEETLRSAPVVIDVDDYQEAVRLGQSLSVPHAIAAAPGQVAPQAGLVTLRVDGVGTAPAAAVHLRAHEHPTDGLLVICTEHSSSARVDDQFRGRSGRQGEPGETRFLVSLEDPLLRLFGGPELDALRPALAARPARGISSPSLHQTVAAVQARVEEQHFLSREQTSEYDQVLSAQREVFSALRERVIQRPAAAPFERERALSAMDLAWSDHLETMEELREAVSWETVIEADPKQAYIHRGYAAFEGLVADLKSQPWYSRAAS